MWSFKHGKVQPGGSNFTSDLPISRSIGFRQLHIASGVCINYVARSCPGISNGVLRLPKYCLGGPPKKEDRRNIPPLISKAFFSLSTAKYQSVHHWDFKSMWGPPLMNIFSPRNATVSDTSQWTPTGVTSDCCLETGCSLVYSEQSAHRVKKIL